MISLKQLLDVCRRLNEKGARYAVIGGWAIFLHGYERATRDIDLIIEDSEENIAKLKEALQDLMPEACGELSVDDVRQNVVVRMAGENLVVDLIQVVGEIDYAALSRRTQVETIGDIRIPFADLDAMLELKGGVRDVDRRDYLFLTGKKDFLTKESKK